MQNNETAAAPVFLHISKGLIGHLPLSARVTDEYFEVLGGILSEHGGTLYAYCLSDIGNQLLLSLAGERIGLFSHDLVCRTARHRNHHQCGNMGYRVVSSRVIVAGNGDSLAGLSRRVHLFPCRNDLAAKPELYRWSSFGSYIGVRSPPSCLSTKPVLSGFGSAADCQTREFMNYTLSGLTGGRPGVSGGSLPVDNRDCPAANTLDGVIQKVLHYYRVPSIRKNSRNIYPVTIRAREMFVWIAKTYHLSGDRGIAEKTGHSLPSAVPRIYRRTNRRLVSDVVSLYQWKEEASDIMSGSRSSPSRIVS